MPRFKIKSGLDIFEQLKVPVHQHTIFLANIDEKHQDSQVALGRTNILLQVQCMTNTLSCRDECQTNVCWVWSQCQARQLTDSGEGR